MSKRLAPSRDLTPAKDCPPRDCQLCPRLKAYRDANTTTQPDWFNAPVPSFGPLDARLLIVGLAPGLKGANRTGRPFTGDYAGDLLYPTLLAYDLAKGAYGGAADDGLTLKGCRITNAVRCVPPQNKPETAEMKACRPFLVNEIAAMQKLSVILALGSIAHTSVIDTLACRRKDHPFGHGARHTLKPGLTLFDSYHCSRYNTNTGRLTEVMFHHVFEAIKHELSI